MGVFIYLFGHGLAAAAAQSYGRVALVTKKVAGTRGIRTWGAGRHGHLAFHVK